MPAIFKDVAGALCCTLGESDFRYAIMQVLIHFQPSQTEENSTAQRNGELILVFVYCATLFVQYQCLCLGYSECVDSVCFRHLKCFMIVSLVDFYELSPYQFSSYSLIIFNTNAFARCLRL